MKKRIVVILVVLMVSILALSGCGQKEIKGEIIDAGEVSALCPEGWVNVPVEDFVRTQQEGETVFDPTRLQFDKISKSQENEFLTLGAWIYYYPKETNTEDLFVNSFSLKSEAWGPKEIGGRTWEGFVGLDLGERNATIWTEDDDAKFYVRVVLEVGKETISLEDADMQAILASIKAK
ncbi:MAG TPA: hypothetical protein VFC73_02135 [Syntrophomonadaceae bacterium]|nr:hypothetical protein [Syntrophomonadaceae bacterium]